MKLWRLIIWLLATLLLWVFAHDYVASHINDRVNSEYQAQLKGSLDFNWSPDDQEHIVTSFDSEVTETGFRGEKVALSYVMPKWPLDTGLYKQFNIRFKVSKPAVIQLALETSDALAEIFYTAKYELQASDVMQTHDIQLDVLDWQGSEGETHKWQDIDKAQTWVVRMFSSEELGWQIEAVSLPQSETIPVVKWDDSDCFNLPDKGHYQSNCSASNRMVQLDHSINQQSTNQTIKFNSWLPIQSWLLGLVVFVLMVLVSWRYRRIQFTVIITASVLVIMLYLPLNLQLMQSDWLNVLLALPMLWFVFIKNRAWWLVNQKSSLKLWLFVVLVSGLLWSQSGYSLEFLALLPAYFLWAGLQQTLMVSLFEWLKNTKSGAFKAPAWFLILFVAWCFSLLHMPNHYLMALTFVGSIFWMFVWQTKKNLLMMVFSHSLWALLLYQSAGEVWLYSARVGYYFL